MREYFDKELTQLNDSLIEMGGLVEQAIKNTMKMIVDGEDLLDIAREHENRINEAEKSIQSRCLHLLLHQAPVAHDLRYVSAALKMITDLERIGDQAVDIAEMSVYIKDKKQVFNLTHILEMADNASKMVTEAIDAFVKSDIEVAKKVARQDDIVDELFNRSKNETVELIHKNKELGSEALDIVMIAKNIYTWMKEICDERGELPMLWGRSGYVGSHTIPAAWAGDSSSDKASHSAILQAGLGMAMSGVSFWGYDLGGFYNTGYIGNEERPNIEDYLSSVQMGLWMPLSRAHGKTPREPWQYGDMALKEVKKWINFRHRLVPYLYHTACQSHQSGIPMIRPLVMEYPKDPIAKTQNLSYMLGDALLISPGFDRDEYELYLPEGRWQDIESKEVYEGMTFVHIENKAFADGGTSLRVFQKEGTSIPLFAQKEVLHVPAQLWKQEDLEFMTFQKKDVD